MKIDLDPKELNAAKNLLRSALVILDTGKHENLSQAYYLIHKAAMQVAFFRDVRK